MRLLNGLRMALCVSALAAAQMPGVADVVVDGRKVIAETDRFKVVIEGLAITGIVNKLTGETYSQSAGADAPTRAEQVMNGQLGVAVESLRPAVPVKYFTICERTVTKVERASVAWFPFLSGNGAVITHTGLQHGSGEQAEFAKDMTISLRVSLDDKTGDLLLASAVKGNIEKAHGVRDRGGAARLTPAAELG